MSNPTTPPLLKQWPGRDVVIEELIGEVIWSKTAVVAAICSPERSADLHIASAVFTIDSSSSDGFYLSAAMGSGVALIRSLRKPGFW